MNGESSGSQSATEICKFLNSFERSLVASYGDDKEDMKDFIRRELDDTERRETSASCRAQSDRYSKKFKNFLRSHGLPDDIERMSEETLNLRLRFFYHGLRDEEGNLLAPSTLGCIRAALHRYLTSAPHNRTIDIINGI
jgi:hypothetical protein